ncbi:rhodanese-like domain-containing protein [uncultured Pelagimonas sp.]|uniref:rhodanese-like domain-containing protein n=1 Tax=uncultured Pelagimonas sp. TaxID=1618102 RepID=UPI00260C1637|nr:rhodanese-like domain-containing protein [uncultured Pelagimonas sp.]
MFENLRSSFLAATLVAMPAIAVAVEEAPMTVTGATTVTVDESLELFDQGVAFVDVRKPSDFEAGRVAGAINLDLNDGFSQESLLEVAGLQDPVVIYCNGAACLRSSKAIAQAVSWGYETVYYMRDGYPVWDIAGFPVE